MLDYCNKVREIQASQRHQCTLPWWEKPWAFAAIFASSIALCSMALNLHLYRQNSNLHSLLHSCRDTQTPCQRGHLLVIEPDSRTAEFKSADIFPRSLTASAPAPASNANATTSCGHASSSNHASHIHQQTALIFLFISVVIGIFILHLKYTRFFHGMQETVALFVIGVFYSLIFHGLNVEDHSGKFGESYTMWMDIDPHLLLFTLLPALLTGDAMTIDTSVVKRVAWQCVYLAGPGVLINAMLVACFLSWYLDWEFLLSLVTGSILCATDPVAVVALLKELGASPVLTIQIQGESLLNDGTAIVLYTVAYKMLQGESFDMPKIMMFLITVALMAWALGMAIGYIFYHWIRAADNKLQHSCEIIQIALTLACGYWSFVLAEGVFHISGVLSCVAASLTLAHFMWPHVVAPDSMHHVWHMLETIGNILIFFLAGALTGKTMVEIDLIDYVHLFVIYMVLLVCRGGLIFLSRPILRFLHTDKVPVTVAEAAVMTWGGLRGAVGLALAIIVHGERAKDNNDVPQISKKDAMRLLFFVGGVAFMTTIINATTCPTLVNWLGITAQSETKVRVIKMIHSKLVDYALNGTQQHGALASLSKVLHYAEEHISHVKVSRTAKAKVPKFIDTVGDLIADLRKSREDVCNLEAETLDLLGYDTETRKTLHDLIQASMERDHVYENSLEGITNTDFDWDMSRLFCEVFLNLVRSAYWRQIETRVLPPGSEEADTLLHSVQTCLSYPHEDLHDFEFVLKYLLDDNQVKLSMHIHHDHEMLKMVTGSKRATSASLEGAFSDSTYESSRRAVRQCLESVWWNSFMAGVFLIDVICVSVEAATTDDNDDNSQRQSIFIIFDCPITLFFVVEVAVGLFVWKRKFFAQAWRIFDFALTVVAVVGLVVDIIVYHQHSHGVPTSSSRAFKLFRISRVLKLVRLLRLFRLMNSLHVLSLNLGHREFSKEQGYHMKKITTLTAYVKAHLHAQRDFVELLVEEDLEAESVALPGAISGDQSTTTTSGVIELPRSTTGVSNKPMGAMVSMGAVSMTSLGSMRKKRVAKTINCELARCLVQSQATIYKAVVLTQTALEHVSRETLEQISEVRESQSLVQEMEAMALDVVAKGALSPSEIESITHPLHEHIRHCQLLISRAMQGFEMGVELRNELTLYRPRSTGPFRRPEVDMSSYESLTMDAYRRYSSRLAKSQGSNGTHQTHSNGSQETKATMLKSLGTCELVESSEDDIARASLPDSLVNRNHVARTLRVDSETTDAPVDTAVLEHAVSAFISANL